MGRRKNRKAKPETAKPVVAEEVVTPVAVAIAEVAAVVEAVLEERVVEVRPEPVVNAPRMEATVRPATEGVLDAASGRRALGGFFLSGLLFSFLGSFLPAWGYHLRSDYLTVGLYFLFLNFGVYVAFHLT